MAILNPPRPGFKRSAERKVTDPNEAIVIEGDRRRDRERAAYEEVGFSPAAASVLVTKPRFEVLTDAIEADDRQFYAEHEAGR